MGERERKIGRETGVGERDTGEKERERQGRKKKKLQTQKNSWNFILSCFTPQKGRKE